MCVSINLSAAVFAEMSVGNKNFFYSKQIFPKVSSHRDKDGKSNMEWMLGVKCSRHHEKCT